MKVGSLFSGIGGLDLGLERAGMRVVWQCEADPYCRAVLRKHWPDVPCYEDVRDVTGDAPAVDLLCGGFPCQPVSFAGKGLAQADERWLWPEFARIVRELRPSYVLVENVPGLLARGLGDVLGDLAASGYDAEWDCLPAAAVGAPHLRYRVFVVGYADGVRRLGWGSAASGVPGLGERPGLDARSAGGAVPDDADGPRHDVADPVSEPVRVQRRREGEGKGPKRERIRADAVDGGSGSPDGDGWPPEPAVGRVVDGFPGRVDQLRALGNAVVPQVAEFVGRQIMRGAA